METPIEREYNSIQPLPPLTLTPTAALIAELKSRFPSGLLILQVDEQRGDAIKYHYTGSMWEVLGMCQRMSDYIRDL